MSEFVDLVQQFPLYIVVLIRTLGLIGTVPIFEHPSIPSPVKISLSALLALVILPVLPPQAVQGFLLPDTILGWICLVAKEMVVGITLGWVASLVVNGVLAAGEFASRDMGLDVAAEFNPDIDSTTTPISHLYLIMMSLLLLALNVHHWFIEALLRTYQVIPINGLSLQPGIHQQLVDLMSWIYVIGVKVAAPVMAIMFLVSAAIGIMSLAAPQVNILLISYPLRMAVGITIVGLSVHVLGRDMQTILLKMRAEMETVMRLMS